MRSTAVAGLALALVAAGCGSSGHAARPGSAAPGARTAQVVGRAHSWRVVVRPAGRLPAPVQLPAVAPLAPDGALVMGGLDSADASSSAIVRLRGGHAAIAGQLPSALHDAAAAT